MSVLNLISFCISAGTFLLLALTAHWLGVAARMRGKSGRMERVMAAVMVLFFVGGLVIIAIGVAGWLS